MNHKIGIYLGRLGELNGENCLILLHNAPTRTFSICNWLTIGGFSSRHGICLVLVNGRIIGSDLNNLVMEADAMHTSHDFHLAHLMHLCYDGAILFFYALGLAMSVAFIAFGLELISAGF